MAFTKIDIANGALIKLRAQTLVTFEDGTPQSDIVKQIYERIIQGCLRSSRWHFAMKKQQLTQLNETPINQWKYSYLLPVDMIKLYCVWNSNLTTILSVNCIEIFGNNRIYTNEKSLWADYTYRLDESYWPVDFVEFVTAALAAELAMPITGDPSLMQLYWNQAYGNPNENNQGGLYAKAALSDASQNPADVLRLNFFEQSRFNYAYQGDRY